MKRILAVLLALMLLAAPVAYAETADAVSLSDIQLYMLDGEEETTLELTGLKLLFATVDENTLAVNVLGDGELLMNAAAKLDGDKLLWTVDGIGTTYYMDVPVPTGEGGGFSMDLEGVDMDAILENLFNAATITKEGDEDLYFSVPYTAVNEALAALLPLAGQLPNSEAINASELEQAIQNLKSNDSGVNLEGWISTSETETYIEVDLYPVEAGTASEDPSGALYIDLQQEGEEISFAVEADAIEGAEETMLFSISFSMADSFDLSVKLMEEVNIGMGFNPADSRAYVAFEAEGITMDLSCAIGSEEGAEIVPCPVGDADGAVSVNDMTDAQKEELMNSMGALMQYLAPIMESVG